VFFFQYGKLFFLKLRYIVKKGAKQHFMAQQKQIVAAGQVILI